MGLPSYFFSSYFCCFGLAFLDTILKGQLERELSYVNGAVVNIEQLNISMSEGELEIVGMQFADSATDRNLSWQIIY